MGILLALIPFIGWGLGDIFGVLASRKVGSYRTTFYQFLFGIILSSFIVPFVWNDVSRITLPLLALNVFLGSLYVLANFFVNEGFKQSSAQVVGIIIQSFPAFVLLLSFLLFRDPISRTQVFWIVLVFIGVFLCSLDIRQLRTQKVTFDKGVRYALAATGIFSLYFTFFRLFSNAYGWFIPNVISFLTLPIALYFARIIIKEKSTLALPKNTNIVGIILVSALLIRSGDIALNLGISLGMAAIVSPIAGAAPVLFIISSAIVFKDKITMQQKIGIALSLVGIVALSILA